MNKHEIKTCPHCQNIFECKSGDIIHCQCESVALTQQQRNYLATLYNDCLCADCLTQLRSDYNIKQFKQKLEKILLKK